MIILQYNMISSQAGDPLGSFEQPDNSHTYSFHLQFWPIGASVMIRDVDCCIRCCLDLLCSFSVNLSHTELSSTLRRPIDVVMFLCNDSIMSGCDICIIGI